MLVVSPASKILIDCGLSYRQLELRSKQVGESLEGLEAVFVTHEHGDHVKGLGVLSRKLGVPIYMTEATEEHLPSGTGKVSGIRHFEPGESISIDGMSVQSFSVCHDAADPVSFVVKTADSQLGLATDLGKVEHVVRQRLHGSHALVLESNYCHMKLLESSYPPAIRQRIAGTHGHLSNKDMNSLLKDLIHDGLELVVLVHVSRENNSEELAREMAARVLQDHRAKLVLAQQDRPTPLFEVAA